MAAPDTDPDFFTRALMRRQETLQASLAEGRDLLDHPTASGDHSELDWQGTLEQFLPNRYQVSRGTVVDATGTSSDAIDLIIHDAQYTPILFQRADGDGSIIVPAESVYAVFEAKPELNKVNLQYAADKVLSVRQLHRTSTSITHAGGRFDPKPPHRIIGGVLADACGWNPCLGDPFFSAMATVTGDRAVDLGCALEGGAFEQLHSEDGDMVGEIQTAPPGLTLMFFLVRLFRRLQSIGTAPAIDIEAYGSAVLTPAGD
jgi:hypothetical protein